MWHVSGFLRDCQSGEGVKDRLAHILRYLDKYEDAGAPQLETVEWRLKCWDKPPRNAKKESDNHGINFFSISVRMLWNQQYLWFAGQLLFSAKKTHRDLQSLYWLMWVQSFGKICNLWPEFFRWKISKTWKNSGGGWVTRVGTTPMWAAQSHVVAWDAFHNITHPFCVEKASRHQCRIVHVWRWKVLLHCTKVQMSSIYLVTFVYCTCLEIRQSHSKSWRRLCTASTLFQRTPFQLPELKVCFYLRSCGVLWEMQVEEANMCNTQIKLNWLSLLFDYHC